MEFGKKIVTEVKDGKLVETIQTIAGGKFVMPRKVRTEENIEVYSRKEQDEEYIKFADEEEKLFKTGKLLEAELQVRHTPASIKRGTKYVVKKFTVLDNSGENGV